MFLINLFSHTNERTLEVFMFLFDFVLSIALRGLWLLLMILSTSIFLRIILSVEILENLINHGSLFRRSAYNCWFYYLLQVLVRRWVLVQHLVGYEILRASRVDLKHFGFFVRLKSIKVRGRISWLNWVCDVAPRLRTSTRRNATFLRFEYMAPLVVISTWRCRVCHEVAWKTFLIRC